MKIIMISLDKTILENNSNSQKRMIEQAKLLDELHIIINTPKWYTNKQLWINTFLYPSNSLIKLNFFLDSYNLCKKIVLNNDFKVNNTVITTQDPFETWLIWYFLKRKFWFWLNIQDHWNFFENKYWKKETIINFLKYYIWLFILKKSDSIRVVSKSEKEYLEKIINRKIISVPLYTDIIKVNNIEKNNNVFNILILARFVKEKNIIFWLKVFIKIVNNFDNINLILIWKWNEKNKIINYIKKNKLEDKIFLKDWTNDIEKEYKNADLFLMTSNYEWWWRTIVESAYYGVPVIMTNTWCAWDFLINNYNWIVIWINKEKELENAIIKMYKNKRFRDKCIENGYKQLKKLPNKQKTLELYKKSWYLALVK